MILITSAAYVSPALVSEFGKLPPAMLPVQNKRLYMHQLKLVPQGEHVVLSLPSDYVLEEGDQMILQEAKVEVVYVPAGLSLGQSVVFSLNMVSRYDEPLFLLHGDTLFDRLDFVPDSCTVANVEDDYAWAETMVGSGEIFSGFFSFSSQQQLIRCITQCNYQFIQGVEKYNQLKPVQRIKNSTWKDFGLANTYYRSISKMTTERVFNSLVATPNSITKRSADKNKMEAEAHWLQSLPVEMKHYAPAVWDAGEDGEVGYYQMEYYYLSSLANLFVFAKNPPYVWNDILKACNAFLTDESRYKPEERQTVADQNRKLFAEKTQSRLALFASQQNIDLDHHWELNGMTVPSLREICQRTADMIETDNLDFVTLMHGDFCFSNILYDFKSKGIKVIDPRGITSEGDLSVYGDLRYDVAKMAHSVIGLYDFIIGGRFAYEESSPYQIQFRVFENETVHNVQRIFESMTFAGYSLQELSVLPMVIHLFLSMLPLHHDNPIRQKALLANALRLYLQLDNHE